MRYLPILRTLTQHVSRDCSLADMGPLGGVVGESIGPFRASDMTP